MMTSLELSDKHTTDSAIPHSVTALTVYRDDQPRAVTDLYGLSVEMTNVDQPPQPTIEPLYGESGQYGYQSVYLPL